jgi:hypothetical protein
LAKWQVETTPKTPIKLMFVFVKVRNSSQAAAAASVASTKPVKNKKFRIYRWNPDKPGDKPKMQVGCDFSVLALNHFLNFCGTSPNFQLLSELP